MLIIWRKKSGFIRDFIEDMKEPLPYTTVASIVKNLEKKGFVKSQRMANSYKYQAKIPQKNYNLNHLSQTAKNYFSNSYKEMVSFFAKEQKISSEELKEIIRMIENGK